MLFRKSRTKRQLAHFQSSASESELAQEKAALTRENAEAPDLTGSPVTPTGIGVELLNATNETLFIPALKPTDNGFKLRGLIEPEGLDEHND